MFRNIIARCSRRGQGVSKPFMRMKAALKLFLKKEKNETLDEWVCVPYEEEEGRAEAAITEEWSHTIVTTIIEPTHPVHGLRVSQSFDMEINSVNSAQPSLPLTPPSTWRGCKAAKDIAKYPIPRAESLFVFAMTNGPSHANVEIGSSGALPVRPTDIPFSVSTSSIAELLAEMRNAAPDWPEDEALALKALSSKGLVGQELKDLLRDGEEE